MGSTDDCAAQASPRLRPRSRSLPVRCCRSSRRIHIIADTYELFPIAGTRQDGGPAVVETSSISHRVADFLKKHAPFNSVDDADLLALAGGGRVRFHEPNEYILWQGEPPACTQPARKPMSSLRVRGPGFRDLRPEVPARVALRGGREPCHAGLSAFDRSARTRSPLSSRSGHATRDSHRWGR